MKAKSVTALGFALLLSTQGATAQTMRCGETVIDAGQLVPMTKEQVLAACGEPASKEFSQWVYERPGQFPMLLQFDSEGNLQSIQEQTADQ